VNCEYKTWDKNKRKEYVFIYNVKREKINVDGKSNHIHFMVDGFQFDDFMTEKSL